MIKYTCPWILKTLLTIKLTKEIIKDFSCWQRKIMRNLMSLYGISIISLIDGLSNSLKMSRPHGNFTIFCSYKFILLRIEQNQKRFDLSCSGSHLLDLLSCVSISTSSAVSVLLSWVPEYRATLDKAYLCLLYNISILIFEINYKFNAYIKNGWVFICFCFFLMMVTIAKAWLQIMNYNQKNFFFGGGRGILG